MDAQMNEAFPLHQKWGVAGGKIDFMSRDDQSMIEFHSGSRRSRRAIT
jgi:alpha-glucosidase